MPATAERAAFVREEYRSSVYTNEGVRDLYGKIARDTEDTPVVSFFDEPLHAWYMVQERGAVLSAHARHFKVTIDDVVGEADLDMALELPTATIIDDDLVCDMAAAVVAIDSLDLEGERTVLRLWGEQAPITNPSPNVPPTLVAEAAGSASGAGSAAAEGTFDLFSQGAASGAGVASGASEAVINAAGSASGAGTATADGVTVIEAAGSAAGTGAATGDAEAGTGAGSASGAGVASGAGMAVVEAAGSASGSGTATGVSPSGNGRITEDGDRRVTEDGDARILED